MGTESDAIRNVRVKISPKGKIILLIGTALCELTEGQVNLLIEKLTSAKNDAKEYKEAYFKIDAIDKIYNGIGVEIPPGK